MQFIFLEYNAKDSGASNSLNYFQEDYLQLVIENHKNGIYYLRRDCSTNKII
jgi:hypothetical protein